MSKKGFTICFRTSEELRGDLETLARKDRRSLSSTIELILTDHLKKNPVSSDRGQQERRRYLRKQVALPAHVKTCGSDTAQHGAVIIDLSLAGMYISMPNECVSKIYEGGDEPRFETSFVLPVGGKTVRVMCKSERVKPSNGNVYVGASFVDADFVNYQYLQQYLM